MNEPVLVLAPHLTYPTRSGADILIDQRWRHVSSYFPYVDVIAQREIWRFRDAGVEQLGNFSNMRRPKNISALRTLMLSSHYLGEVFLTPTYKQVASRYVKEHAFGTIVCSYLFTADWLRRWLLRSATPGGKYCLVVETHNDEMRWYENLSESTNNPLKKLVARQSAAWAGKTVKSLSEDFVFMHVTRFDQAGYRAIHPDHKSIVAPVGVRLPGAEIFGKRNKSTRDEKIRLVFFGSLGVQMNQDALRHFSRVYFPVLNRYFGDRLEVNVAGSKPSSEVRRVCRDYGWNLHLNITDDELENLLVHSTFTILPFPYTTGSKLKVLQSLAFGVPLLATSVLKEHIPDGLKTCLISDRPEDWVEHILELESNGGMNKEGVAQLRTAVEPFAWEKIAEHVAEKLRDCERGYVEA